MKARITLKTPDSLLDSIKRMAEDEIGGGDSDNLELQEQLDEEFDSLVLKSMKRAENWFRYGELVTLEIDFDEDTCTVIRV